MELSFRGTMTGGKRGRGGGDHDDVTSITIMPADYFPSSPENPTGAFPRAPRGPRLRIITAARVPRARGSTAKREREKERDKERVGEGGWIVSRRLCRPWLCLCVRARLSRECEKLCNPDRRTLFLPSINRDYAVRGESASVDGLQI